MAELYENRYIEILGGLTGRLTVLGSLINNDLPFKYQIVWDNTQPGCNCSFNELFQNKFNFIDKKDIDFNNIKIQTFGDTIDVYDYHHQLLPVNFNKTSITTGGFFFHDSCNYIIMDWPVYHQAEFSNGHQNLKRLVKNLVLTNELQQIYNKYILQFSNNTVGIYFRGCINTINEMSSSTTDFSSFYDLVNSILLENDTNKVFIATGSQDFFDKVKLINNNRIIMLDENKYPIDAGYSSNGVKRALLEWLLLSKTNKAYISGGGFAYKACSFNNIEVIKI